MVNKMLYEIYSIETRSGTALREGVETLLLLLLVLNRFYVIIIIICMLC
jgi:hypothetical protein